MTKIFKITHIISGISNNHHGHNNNNNIESGNVNSNSNHKYWIECVCTFISKHKLFFYNYYI